MGADLIINAIACPVNKEMEPNKGKQAVKDMAFTEEQLQVYCDMFLAEPYEPESLEPPLDEPYEDRLRAHLIQRIDELFDGIVGNTRDTSMIRFGEYAIFIAGGSSWGDSPGPTFQALQELWEFPDILQAMGFEWPGIIGEPEEDLPLAEMEA